MNCLWNATNSSHRRRREHDRTGQVAPNGLVARPAMLLM